MATNLTTNNYDLFVLLKVNRDVNPQHVKKIKESMSRHGFFPSEAITVRRIEGSRKYEVTDGQHRLAAAKELGLIVYYKIDEAITIDALPDLQISQKWLPKDYLKLYSVGGNEHYINLKNIYDSYNKVSIMTIVAMLMGSGGGDGIYHKFNTGQFTITNLALTERTLQLAESLYKMYPHSFLHSRLFLFSFLKVLSLPDYNHKRMLEKLEYQSEKFKQMSTPKGYAEMFDNIYNFKALTQNRIKFDII